MPELNVASARALGKKPDTSLAWPALLELIGRASGAATRGAWDVGSDIVHGKSHAEALGRLPASLARGWEDQTSFADLFPTMIPDDYRKAPVPLQLGGSATTTTPEQVLQGLGYAGDMAMPGPGEASTAAHAAAGGPVAYALMRLLEGGKGAERGD